MLHVGTFERYKSKTATWEYGVPLSTMVTVFSVREIINATVIVLTAKLVIGVTIWVAKSDNLGETYM